MKIAVSAEKPNTDSSVDPRFGRAKFFMVFDDEDGTWEAFDNNQNLQASQGAGIQAAANVVNAGCRVLISGHCGPKAFTALCRAGVAVYCAGSGTVRDVVESYRHGHLKKLDAADVEGHW
jgi:predicted Fe-Mo cluster-binding NifX family protein